jgi:ubiquitin C-terminal hydrolase
MEGSELILIYLLFKCHSGTVGSGHYTSYVQNGSLWYKTDDSQVNQCLENTVRVKGWGSCFYMLS